LEKGIEYGVNSMGAGHNMAEQNKNIINVA
jgi:hypothetical protein